MKYSGFTHICYAVDLCNVVTAIFEFKAHIVTVAEIICKLIENMAVSTCTALCESSIYT